MVRKKRVAIKKVAVTIEAAPKAQASTLAVSLGSTSTTILLFGDFKTIYCPDGSPVLVLKNLDKAFKTFVKEWDSTIGVVIERLKGFAAKVGIDVKQKVVNFYQNLDRINKDLRDHYTMNYITWATRPCDKESAEILRKANEKVSESTFALRRLQIEAEKEAPDVQKLEQLVTLLTDIVPKSQKQAEIEKD